MERNYVTVTVCILTCARKPTWVSLIYISDEWSVRWWCVVGSSRRTWWRACRLQACVARRSRGRSWRRRAATSGLALGTPADHPSRRGTRPGRRPRSPRTACSPSRSCRSRLAARSRSAGRRARPPAAALPTSRPSLHDNHTARRDSAVCVVSGGVNWVPDNSRLSPTENVKSENVNSNCPIHAATPDTTQTGLFFVSGAGDVNWIGPTSAFCVGMRPAVAPAVNSVGQSRVSVHCFTNVVSRITARHDLFPVIDYVVSHWLYDALGYL